MAIQKHTHRHLVALPLAAVLLGAIALTNAVLPVSASVLALTKHDLVLSAGETAKSIDLPSGLHLSLEPGAEAHVGADDTLVVRGGVLADASTLASLSLPCLTITVLNSAAYASVSEDSVSIVAVRGPVLAASCDGRTILLAEGEQAFVSPKAADVSAVPSVWLSGMQSRLLSRPPSEESVPDVFSAPFVTGASSADVAAAFSAAAPNGDAVTTLLAFRLLPILARFDDTTKETVYAALFSSDALQTQVVHALPQAVLVSLFTLDETVLSKWTDAAAVAASADPKAFSSLLQRIADLPSRLETAGYPKQSRLWLQAIESATAILRPLVASSERESVDASLLRARDHAAADQPVLLRNPVSGPPLTESELLALTEDMLGRAEVLRSSVTTVTPDTESRTVRIERVYLSEDGKDVAYDFTYAPAAGLLSGIVRDGVRLPNSMNADALFPLLRKEAP